MPPSNIWPPLLADLLAVEDELSFHRAAVKQFVELEDVSGVAIVRSQPPDWVVTAAAGPEADHAPTELAGEALDASQTKRTGDWTATPLAGESLPPTVLMVRESAQASRLLEAEGLAAGCLLARGRRRDRRHAERLATLLEITHQWAQTDNLETLLNRMAEEATQLFDADRATIFLWDRAKKMLVGRPALGLENNELRVPDDAGVVGRVVQSGEPERVDLADDRAAIHGAVDKQTGYSTETILCVPLIGPKGKTHGAFELLNKREGNFTSDDETGLTELATYAAVALANTQQWEELLQRHQQMLEEAAGSVQMIGNCPPIEALRSTIAKVADTDLAILV
ncbi:MAG: GAF domain-containing protein, partial [Aeoliella sp.]